MNLASLSALDRPAVPSGDRPLTPPGRWIAAARDRRNLHLRFFSRCVNRACWLMGRFTWFCTMKVEVIRAEKMDRAGGYLVACTHLSHLEPFILSFLYNRQIDWLTRIEFYCSWFHAWILPRVGAIPVNRYGVPVSTIRTAISRLKAGRVVGICPEGGVCIGNLSVCRGAPIKHGACLVSQRTGAAILPCVMVGTHELNRVGPWLPFRRGRLWVAFGEPLQPAQDNGDRKRSRETMAIELQDRLAALYREILTRYQIDDRSIP